MREQHSQFLKNCECYNKKTRLQLLLQASFFIVVITFKAVLSLLAQTKVYSTGA